MRWRLGCDLSPKARSVKGDKLHPNRHRIQLYQHTICMYQRIICMYLVCWLFIILPITGGQLCAGGGPVWRAPFSSAALGRLDPDVTQALTTCGMFACLCRLFVCLFPYSLLVFFERFKKQLLQAFLRSTPFGLPWTLLNALSLQLSSSMRRTARYRSTTHRVQASTHAHIHTCMHTHRQTH